MPLEIKELHIKVSVGQHQQSGPSPSISEDKENKDHLIREIVEKVLAILNEKSER